MAKNYVQGATLHLGDESFTFSSVREAIEAFKWVRAQDDVQAVFPCTWTVERWPVVDDDEEGGWYPDSPSDLLADCGGLVVGTSRGWHGLCGHSHVSGAQYYTEDEVAHNLRNGYMVPEDALLMDGRPVSAVR
jgi:hypothetical protein